MEQVEGPPGTGRANASAMRPRPADQEDQRQCPSKALLPDGFRREHQGCLIRRNPAPAVVLVS